MKETVSDGAREFGGELIPKVRCSVLKRAISDFQRGSRWWTGKSDHRRRTRPTGIVFRNMSRRPLLTALWSYNV